MYDKNYQLCVFDLDGTLLQRDLTISKEDSHMIRRLRARGCQITIATGRLDIMTRVYQEELAVDMPVISCNGAVIGQRSERCFSHIFPLDNDVVNKIVSYCRQNNMYFHLYSDTSVYTEALNGEIIDVEGDRKSVGIPHHSSMIIHHNAIDLLTLGIHICKILIPLYSLEDFKAIRSILDDVDDIDCYYSKRCVEIGKKGVSKGSSLELICENLSIPLSSVVVFGDGSNDLSMFNVAGTAIAMRNAPQKLKDKADYITLEHFSAGVAYAIERWLM